MTDVGSGLSPRYFSGIATQTNTRRTVPVTYASTRYAVSTVIGNLQRDRRLVQSHPGARGWPNRPRPTPTGSTPTGSTPTGPTTDRRSLIGHSAGRARS